MAGNVQGQSALFSNERNLSNVVHSLFSAWMLAFLFQGQVFYSITRYHGHEPSQMVLGGIAAILAGLLLCGRFIRTKRAARRLFLSSYPIFMATTVLFFFPPSALWSVAVVSSSFLSGCCVAAWAYYLRSGTPKNERLKAIADMLILSNILMIALNAVDSFISPHAALASSMLMLFCAFLLALRLPLDGGRGGDAGHGPSEKTPAISGLLGFLCLFIFIITINSGLMYQVVNPAFAHLGKIVSLYWAVPYIAALAIMRELPHETNRGYILYVAIAMIGLSFVGFMALGRGAGSYLVVDTLMLAACGVYDLFWWSILGEMLEYHDNPSVILGIGLSANVFGVLVGGLLGNAITSGDAESPGPSLLALTVVCVTLALLPPLHKHLSSLLKGHLYLTAFSGMSVEEQISGAERAFRFGNLSERERQVATLLLQGKTYRAIAGELYISENTVKYYVKNIYSKLCIQSRAELIDIALKK